jgi:GNAT superfamily N-acetyltransferase
MEAVRSATADDASSLARLLDELHQNVATQRGGQLLIEDDGGEVLRTDPGDLLAQTSVDPSRLLLVGLLDDVVIGFALCHVDTRRRGRGVLDACYVEQHARDVGVGRLLLDSAVAWLADQGCSGIDGTALPGDRSAKNFFEAAGFKARVLTMYRAL